MRTQRFLSFLLTAWVAAVAGCGGSSDRAELERLRRENEALRAQVGQSRPRPVTDSRILAYFAQDTAQGTLAGLAPGDLLEQARARFGQETRTRTWASEARPITQYEWELVGGVTLRCNADPDGRLVKIAVAFVRPESVDIPTLNGLILGRETFLGIQQRFAAALTTDLQIWGAQGLYTIAQRTLLPNSGWRLEFVYLMPPGLGQGQLDRIEELVQRQRNPAVLEPYLAERAPYLVALEEVR